jgi:ABC-2 type transport system permease protein
MSTTTATAGAGAVAAPDLPRPTGAGLVAAAGGTARRTILQFARTPQLIMMATVQGAAVLFLFRYIFGGAIDTIGGVSYVDYLVPGYLATTFLWNGMSATAGVAEDSSSGVYDRLRSLPIPRSAVMIGRSAGDMALSSWGLLVTTVLGFAVGFRTGGDVGEIVLAFGVMLAAGYALTWMFIALGLLAKNAQAAQGMSFMAVLPLTFMSSAYVPAESLPGWMQPVADHQPITAIANAVRSLMLGGTDAAGIGHSTTYWVALSLAWSAGILVVFAGLAVSRFARRR